MIAQTSRKIEEIFTPGTIRYQRTHTETQNWHVVTSTLTKANGEVHQVQRIIAK